MRVRKNEFFASAFRQIVLTYLIIYVMLFYGIYTVWFVNRLSEEILFDVEKLKIYLTMYRCFEIHFAAVILFYNLLISNFEMSTFTIAGTVLACLDMLINIIELGIALSYRLFVESRSLPDVICVTLMGTVLSVLMVPFLMISVYLGLLVYRPCCDVENGDINEIHTVCT